MGYEYINLTPENLPAEHLSCIIRSRTSHPGVEAKRQWLAARLPEGHVFRKLNEKANVMIEYAPLETAWTPVIGENYIYLYCLWVGKEHTGRGHGTALMQYCLDDARSQGKSGVCMLGAKRQRSWLSDQSFAKRFGFETVDETDSGYELLALSFDGTVPCFAPNAKQNRIAQETLTIYYDLQCPYIFQEMEQIRKYCAENRIPVTFIQVDTLQKAKALPCVFNNWAVFYKGRFETVNLIDTAALKRILRD